MTLDRSRRPAAAGEAMGIGVCRETTEGRVLVQCVEHGSHSPESLLKRGGFSACQLFGHELDPPEGEPFDPKVERLVLARYMADSFITRNMLTKRVLRQKLNTGCLMPRT